MPKLPDIKKVLLIGSGPIVIGQAAEFDYAGAQACRILKNEGVNVVLVNSNPATIMTDAALADEIYLEPLTLKTLKRIIEKEKPDSILATLGGQTGLTLAMKLHKEGFLEKRGIRLLGTNAEAVIKAEDREIFKETMEKIGQPCIASRIANDMKEAYTAAKEVGYPVIIRPAFTLGGYGGGVAYNKKEFDIVAANGLKQSPINQILVEKYIYGWKEIEFEVMRDSVGTVIAVCSMENFDPVGVHTGDSIVVAPALTLADKEYQMLRSASLDIITELGIEGGCNCQFALNPDTFEYSVIEVNPRVSRSSALASKATGYPIAKVSTKIALGYTLDEIINDITGKTYACFEPTLDYVVVKFPKWPFDKFQTSSRNLGTQMKATGEVMSIATNFESALLKAVRGAEISLDSLNMKGKPGDIVKKLGEMTDHRLFNVFAAIKGGVSLDEIYKITRIDKYFLSRLKNLVDYEKEIASQKLSKELYMKGKHLGYTNAAIEKISGQHNLFTSDTVYKMVDTCAGEFPAETPYFYATYDECDEAAHFINHDKPTVLVLGSGPIRIGQGIEFDYSSVHCAWALKRLGYDVVIVNNNPETVSTDFDVADRLYFEPLTAEDVENIIKIEKPLGVVVAFGGQTAIKLTKHLDATGVKVLGTSADSIDLAEDRERFNKLLRALDIKQPSGKGVTSVDGAVKAAKELGYPVLVRPSYVIGGQNMTIAFSDADILRYMQTIMNDELDNPVLIDKYLMGLELEVDVISDGEKVLIPGIMEHVERAGIHSGDSIALYPPQNLSDDMCAEIGEVSRKLALALNTKGLINIQYLIYQGQLYVIEVNPRASRTIPYISKVTGVPMVDIATRVMMGEPLLSCGYGEGLYKEPPYVAVKVPVFSFEKLVDVNSLLGPEMKSTGEVLGVGKNLHEALFKGLVSAGFKLSYTPGKSGVYISVQDNDKHDAVTLAKKFYDLGMTIYATKGTADAIGQLGNDFVLVDNTDEQNNIFKYLEEGKIQYIVNTCPNIRSFVEHHIKLHRRAQQLQITCLSSLDTAHALADILASGFNENNTELVDINAMRSEHILLNFSKMHCQGNDYICLDNFGGEITFPESVATIFCKRNNSIGADGLILINGSDKADAEIRMFNSDGSEVQMGGNCLRCVTKYLYDKGIVKKKQISIDTVSGIRNNFITLTKNEAGVITGEIGKPVFTPSLVPALFDGDAIINRDAVFGGREYKITCLSVGNPHCVVFSKRVDDIDIEVEGSAIENAPCFPERINTEFVRVIDRHTLKMRVWERGNGETLSCGTGACAAAVAAVLNGFCDKNDVITVKTKGGDMFVKYEDDMVYLSGTASLIYDGVIRI